MRNGIETRVVRENVCGKSWFDQGKIYLMRHHGDDERKLFYIDVSNDNVEMADNFKLPEGTPFEDPQNVQYLIHIYNDICPSPSGEVKPVRWDE